MNPEDIVKLTVSQARALLNLVAIEHARWCRGAIVSSASDLCKIRYGLRLWTGYYDKEIRAGGGGLTINYGGMRPVYEARARVLSYI